VPLPEDAVSYPLQPTLPLFADATTTVSVRLGGADISECGNYRYRLWREWDSSNPKRACFALLNPSTANSTDDDPTVRRCIQFAIDFGCGALDVINLFAWRATDPRQLMRGTIAAMIGPDNDNAIGRVAAKASVVIAAWGAMPYLHSHLTPRALAVERQLRGIGALHALKLTKDGHPSHPLYLRGSLRPVPWIHQ